MEILYFSPGLPPRRLDALEQLPEQGYVWVDFLRQESEGWAERIAGLLGCSVDAEHLSDSCNPLHPSFFDGTTDYDMLVFEGPGPREEPFPLETRAAVFFLFERLLVTIHSGDSPSFAAAREKLARARSPHSQLGLALTILDTMVDRYLFLRERLDYRLTRMQDELLDPKSRHDDWRGLLEGRREARKLESLCETQREALDAWRRHTRFEWSPAEEIRIRDLAEHVRRVLDHASNAERDVEAAVQLHFASVTHRTNRIVQTLTVISAIFFPLTLVTGIYGMNFEHMPELHTRYGYFVVLGGLVALAAVLLLLFKRRGYL